MRSLLRVQIFFRVLHSTILINIKRWLNSKGSTEGSNPTLGISELQTRQKTLAQGTVLTPLEELMWVISSYPVCSRNRGWLLLPFRNFKQESWLKSFRKKLKMQNP